MKDLHIHTKYSDGEYDEKQIVQEIKKAGIVEFAICDHDTINGSKAVRDYLNTINHNLIFHSGIELTCRLNNYMGGVNMHLLLHDFDYNDTRVLDVVKNISYLRLQKVKKMVQFVESEYNIKIPTNKLQEKLKNTDSFGKPHLYSIMCEIGVFDREQYYRKMDKLSTSEFKLDSKDTIKKLNGVGKLILAHPIEIMKEYNYDLSDIEKIIKKLKEFGLNGVETYHSSQTKQIQMGLSKICQKYNLTESCGSDFHGPNVKPNLKIGDIQKKEN